jgi:hypothetical protein
MLAPLNAVLIAHARSRSNQGATMRLSAALGPDGTMPRRHGQRDDGGDHLGEAVGEIAKIGGRDTSLCFFGYAPSGMRARSGAEVDRSLRSGAPSGHTSASCGSTASAS